MNMFIDYGKSVVIKVSLIAFLTMIVIASVACKRTDDSWKSTGDYRVVSTQNTFTLMITRTYGVRFAVREYNHSEKLTIDLLSSPCPRDVSVLFDENQSAYLAKTLPVELIMSSFYNTCGNLDDEDLSSSPIIGMVISNDEIDGIFVVDEYREPIPYSNVSSVTQYSYGEFDSTAEHYVSECDMTVLSDEREIVLQHDSIAVYNFALLPAMRCPQFNAEVVPELEEKVQYYYVVDLRLKHGTMRSR